MPHEAPDGMVDEREDSGTDRGGAPGVAGAAVVGAGAAATATTAAACCVPVLSPLLVTVLGASGAAWITGLEPWAPYLLAGAFVLLLHAAWKLRRARRCRVEGAPSPAGWRGMLDRTTPVILGFAAVVWMASLLAYVLFS
ncbi:MAG TPA: hypothetical protein VLL48_13120 [Longimicrobiales bacterium]|nr:hypothetical protein [Longimicrobiales bacterium]